MFQEIGIKTQISKTQSLFAIVMKTVMAPTINSSFKNHDGG